MRKILSIVVILCSLSLSAQEQSNTAYTLGIKTGLNFSTLLGSEFENPRPRFGYTGGAYFLYPVKSGLAWQAEVLANLRGSRFANPSGEYQDIDLFTIDFPIMLGYDLSDGKQYLFAGIQTSTIILSAVYLDPKGKVHKTGLDFNPVLFDAVVAYQIKRGVVGYQLAVKGSIQDMNRDIFLEDVLPSTAHDGSIYNFSAELSLIF